MTTDLAPVDGAPPAKVNRRKKYKNVEYNGSKIRVKRMVYDAITLLSWGKARNISEAAKVLGCSRAYLSTELNKPDARTALLHVTKLRLFSAAPVAAHTLASLLHAESEKIQLEASKHLLGLNGIALSGGNGAPATTVNLSVTSPGYVIDLRDPADRRDVEHDQRRAPARIDRDSAEDFDGEFGPAEPEPESLADIIARLG